MSKSVGNPKFHGREEELRKLRGWFNHADKNRQPVFGVIVANSGLGKTRLVQELYHALSNDNDLDPKRYWPPTFGDSGENLEVNPILEKHEPEGAPKFIWLGKRFLNPYDRLTSNEPLLPTLRERTREHRILSEIWKYPTLAKKIWDELRQKGRLFISDNIGNQLDNLVENQLENLVEAGVDLAADALPSIKLIIKSVKQAIEKQEAHRSGAAHSHIHKKHEEHALESLTKELERFETEQKSQMPIVLWLDDAQWIDEESVGVIERLLNKAKDKKFTIMIIATHWEGEWMECCDENKGITRLFTADIDKAKVQNFNDDPEKMEYDSEDEGLKRIILKLDKLENTTLRSIVEDNLPGLPSRQQDIILKTVKGHVLGLMEIVNTLNSDKLYFKEEGDQTELSPAGEKLIETMPTERNRQAERIFKHTLDQGQKILLGYGSKSGTHSGFKQSVVCAAADLLIRSKPVDVPKVYDTKKGLGLLGKRRLLARHGETEVWEFRDDLYYDLAWRYYNNELQNYHHYLESKIREDMVDRIKSCFNSVSGELIGEDGLMAKPEAERRGQLQEACISLTGDTMPGTSNEPGEFRARCLLVREYTMADMGERAREEGAKLKKYAWDEKGEESYVHKLGENFRWALCNILVEVRQFDVALAIAHNLEIWFGDIHARTDENKAQLAESKKRYADIIVKWSAAEKDNKSDWVAAEQRCNEAIGIFDDLFGAKDGQKEASPEWYTHLKDCNMLLSWIKEKTGDHDEGERLLSTAKGHMNRLCKDSNKPENRIQLASVYKEIGEMKIRQGKWEDAEEELRNQSEILSGLCGPDCGDYELFEDYAVCLAKLKDIYNRLARHEEANDHSKKWLETRLRLAERACEDYKRGEKNDLEDFYEQYSNLAISLAKEDEGKGEDECAQKKIEDCKQAWQCCKEALEERENDQGISALKKQGRFMHEWSKHKYEQARKSLDHAKENAKRAADISSELDSLIGSRTDRLSGENLGEKIVLGKSYIEGAIKSVDKTKGLVSVAKTLLEDCEEVRRNIAESLNLSENRKNQAETMLLLTEVLYEQYSLVGPLDQGGRYSKDLTSDELRRRVEASMEERIGDINYLCDTFREEFVEDRKRIENGTKGLLIKVKELKREVRGGYHKDIYKKLQELENRIPEYVEKLHKAQTQNKQKIDQEGISKRRRLQVLVASIPLVAILIVWSLSASVTVVDVVVRTARPAPVSWETIEGGTGRLFGRTWLWTDTASVRASAPGHQSKEVTLSREGAGSFELVLEPVPGVAEIDIVGEGPMMLSIDGAARQAQSAMRIELAHGPHKALLTGPNIVPTEIDFEMQGFGNVQQFQWSAMSANSFLDVQIRPQTAEVLLDGQPWAVGSRKAGVPVGRHTLSASIPGWHSKSEVFEAVVDNTASFRWTLRPKPAVLALSTEPSGVAVLLNGDYVGQSPVSLNLPANKRHVISARQSGRDPVELALSPAPGERMERTLRLEARTAKVAFSASGSATVRVNGVHSGRLPLTVELREGDRVEAVADGLAAAPYVVTKLESATSSHRFQLMPPDQLAHRSTPELEEVLPGLQLKRIPWSAMGATVSRPFRIAVQEVTYAAYSELLAQTPPSGLTAQHPVVNISWTQAAQFTNALSAKHGLPPVYVFDRSGYLLSVNQQSLGFRLPTEAEWLAAAGQGWARPKGAVRPNWAGSERRSGLRMPGHTDRWLELAPAQQAVLGAFDLRGMAGNAAEWLHDYYAPWPSAPPPGYAGPALGIDHAVRGGSYLTAEKPEARGFSAKGRPDLGFRVAQWLY